MDVPQYLLQGLAGGLNYAKSLTPGDSVASTSPVFAPWRTPSGSVISGDIAVPEGAPIPEDFTLVMDGSAVPANQTFNVRLFDGALIHANGCYSCPGNIQYVDPVCNGVDCNVYSSLLNILCSQPHLITGIEVKVYNTAASPYLPKEINWSRKNIRGEGPNGIITLTEDVTVYPRPNMSFAVKSLTNASGRIDTQTLWEMKSIPGGNKIEIRFFVTAAKAY